MKAFKPIQVRPYQLMCIVCRLGSSGGRVPRDPALARILRAVRRDPGAPLMLRCNADAVYGYQNPGRRADTPEGALFNEKRDLDIIQRMGLVPGDVRPARELFRRLLEKVESGRGVCGYGPGGPKAWRGCGRSRSGGYERGRAHGLAAVVPDRPAADKRRHKRLSARAVLEAGVLRLRPHHLMCMACFHAGRKDLAPIEEDNLFEAIDVVQRNPDIPILLVRGCCMICPPCSSYDPATNLCVSAQGMSLRDQKKDLDLLQRLGLEYGAQLPARELFRRLFAAIRSTREICGYTDGQARAWEWSVCGGPDGSPGYARARTAGMGIRECAGRPTRKR